MNTSHKSLAERFIRGIYGGDPEVIEKFAGENIIISYPIFAQIFNAPVLKGKEAAKRFAAGFSKRWAQPKITIHAALEEDHRVVLLWSFQAQQSEDMSIHQWGGISIFQFDQNGKIVAEIGEESTPGPFARWHEGHPSPSK